MTNDEKERYVAMTGCIDGLIYKCLEAEAWNQTLLKHLSEFKQQTTGENLKNIQDSLKADQKAYLQKLLERVENKSPSIAAQIDQRDIKDV
jgi:hypothetical protein